MNSTRAQWINALIITLSVVLTPIVGIFGPFQNGTPQGQGQTSPELFLPAGYAFSVWSVIYIGLFVFGIWQGLPAQTNNKRVRRAAPWISLSAIGNVIWILFAGSVETVPWTIPAILIMEIPAWIAYLRLRINQPDIPAGERLIHIPLQVYVGWLSVATVANSAAALNVLGWGGWGFSDEFWTVLMTVIATALAWIVGQRTGHDNVYRGVFVWAFVAIWVAQQAYPVVAWTAMAAAIVVALMIVLTRFGRNRSRRLVLG